MKLQCMGDRAAVLRGLTIEPSLAAELLEDSGLRGLEEAVASYDTVGLYGQVSLLDLEAISRVLEGAQTRHATGRMHELPVCYELGPDLPAVCRTLGLEPEEFVALHTSAAYKCFAIGFCPGFPYLGYLPDRLAGVARLPNPRTRVEPGSVGITGWQTGVYPLERPGGWTLVGKTPLVLVDVAEGFFPIRAGDTVRFVAVGQDEYRARRGERA